MRRLLKVAEAIRSVVGMAILTEVRDPRVKNVTVTGVSVAPDLRSAKVKVSVMGSARAQQQTLEGLQHSAGFLQKRIAERIEMRWTPRLTFELDEGVKKSIEVARLLNQVLPKPEIEDDEFDTDESDVEEFDADDPGGFDTPDSKPHGSMGGDRDAADFRSGGSGEPNAVEPGAGDPDKPPPPPAT